MFLSTMRLAIPIEKHNDALKVLKSIAVQFRDDPGCLSCRVYKDIEDESVIMLQESWEGEETLNRHVRSNEYRNLLLVLEMSLKQPEVRFDTISSSTGIETVERIRSAIGRG